MGQSHLNYIAYSRNIDEHYKLQCWGLTRISEKRQLSEKFGVFGTFDDGCLR